jgi:hypothetical protein
VKVPRQCRNSRKIYVCSEGTTRRGVSTGAKISNANDVVDSYLYRPAKAIKKTMIHFSVLVKMLYFISGSRSTSVMVVVTGASVAIISWAGELEEAFLSASIFVGLSGVKSNERIFACWLYVDPRVHAVRQCRAPVGLIMTQWGHPAPLPRKRARFILGLFSTNLDKKGGYQ